ncbi:MAG: LytTR family transcriptional regulator, partial [Bacteroidales bacterium]|nr:LytTR family transcriptional regulator [Bacteroidales bacterium]
LPPERFFRINRSNIVNIGLIKKIETKNLKCVLNKDGKEFRIDISRERIKELVEIMKNL